MLITCGGCAAEWTGAGKCHCSGCHETFSGIGLFDRHRSRYGEHGSCKSPADLPGIELRDGVWSYPQMTEQDKRDRFGA